MDVLKNYWLSIVTVGALIVGGVVVVESQGSSNWAQKDAASATAFNRHLAVVERQAARTAARESAANDAFQRTVERQNARLGRPPQAGASRAGQGRTPAETTTVGDPAPPIRLSTATGASTTTQPSAPRTMFDASAARICKTANLGLEADLNAAGGGVNERKYIGSLYAEAKTLHHEVAAFKGLSVPPELKRPVGSLILLYTYAAKEFKIAGKIDALGDDGSGAVDDGLNDLASAQPIATALGLADCANE